MTARRIRFNRSLFALQVGQERLEELLSELAAEDIELLVDLRASVKEPQDEEDLDALCANAEMYYVHFAHFGAAEREHTARLALRHRTCVLADHEALSTEATEAVANEAGMRVIDLEASPAPVVKQVLDRDG